MTCEHLITLEQALLKAGFPETFRGQARSANCTEWVYFDGLLSNDKIRKQSKSADCVEDHDHLGIIDGAENVLVCSMHQDAIIGLHPKMTFTAQRKFPE